MSEVVELSGNGDAPMRRAAEAIRRGELVVIPTDTVYGIAADAFTPGATDRIFELKKRPRSMPLPILVSRPRQAWAVCDSVPEQAAELAAAFWPGALTLIMPMTPDLDWDLGDSKGTIALRMPDHEATLRLLEMTGPLAVTSANVSGDPTPSTIEEIRGYFGDAVSVYVDGGPAKQETGSTIVDLARRKPTVIREGPISAAEIERVIGSKIARA